MMRLIDADELLKHIPPEEVCSRFAVVNAPTVEPERKKGRWIHDGYDLPYEADWAPGPSGVDWMHCSECGQREPNAPAAKIPDCPGCGADMREGGGE